MKVIIAGAGSTAQSIASILMDDYNFKVIGFTDKDNKSKGKKILGVEVIGNHSLWKGLFRQGICGAVVAIGYDNNMREEYFHELKGMGFEMINVIHKSAFIDKGVIIDEGVVVGPGCILNPMVKIERNTILEAGVVLGANTQIADNVYVGIGCNIGGESLIKRNAFLSSGCSVAPFVTIGKNVKLSPGVSVDKNIPDRLRSK